MVNAADSSLMSFTRGNWLQLFALLLGATMAGLYTRAATIPPGGVAVTHSGKNLIFSFPTTSPNFYTVQTSPDLQRWSNSPPGVVGNGSAQSVTVTNAVSGSEGFYRLSIQTPLTLVLPQGNAFSILGYDCGGIEEQVSAGFGVTNGLPTGVVNLQTSCSAGKAGTPPSIHKATALVTWDLSGNVISAVKITNGVTGGPTTGADGKGDVIYNPAAVAYLIVPAPGKPTGVTAVQSGDQFQVSWTPNAANPAAITSSTLTATPVNSAASVLTATVAGSATSGIITTLQPQTTYRVTVINKNIGGSSPPSAPVSVTTSPATVPPSAPTGVTATWQVLDPTGTTDSMTVTWQPAIPGNSPVDQYVIVIVGSDGGGTFTNTVSGTTLTTYFNGMDYIPNYAVTVQAHNAAGWGPVSAAVNLGGL
jgi:hypothetical protein